MPSSARRLADTTVLIFTTTVGQVQTGDEGLAPPSVAEALPEQAPSLTPGDDQPSEPIWIGKVALTFGAKSATGTAEIRWHWRPSPSIRASVSTDENVFNGIPAWEPTTFVLDDCTVEGFFPLQRSSGFEQPFGRVLELQDLLIGDKQPAVDTISFRVVNFPRYFGAPIRRSGSSSASRLILQPTGWEITLDVVADFPWKGDTPRGGFAVTHLGRLRRQDGTTFDYTTGSSVLNSLWWMLSLLRGAYAAPVAWVGELDGAPQWTRHAAMIMDPWMNHEGVFPENESIQLVLPDFPEQVSGALSHLIEAFADPKRETAYMRALHWYCTANNGHTDGDLILAQSGLELLGHMLLVTTGSMSADGYEKLVASDKIRLMLSLLKLDASLPVELPNLAAWAKSNNVPGGPEAVARRRNMLTHSGKDVGDWEVSSDARDLALYYLELALLSIVGYKSIIRDRLVLWLGVRPMPNR